MTDSLSLFGNTASPSLFDTQPAPAHQDAPEASGADVETFLHQLMAETGCSAEEAGEAYMRQLAKQKEAKALPQQSYFSLQTKEEKAEYMKRIRENASGSVWIPPQLKELEQSDINVANAQAQFTQNMKAKSKNTNQAAIDFFRNYGKK